MYEKLKEIKMEWENNLCSIYKAELEVDYIDGAYYACAYHDEPRGGYDSWLEEIKEFSCLGNDKSIEIACHKLGIPVCH